MLKKRIIPCLDVKDGRVVKGINFLDLVDAGDPVQQAKFYSENGADEICFLDISASLENRDTILKMVEKTAEEVFIPLTESLQQQHKYLPAKLIPQGTKLVYQLVTKNGIVIEATEEHPEESQPEEGEQ